MPYKALMQIPVQTHSDEIWLFQKRIDFNLPPFPGMLVVGRGIPQVLPADVGWSSIIREVGEDVDNGMIFVNLQGLREVTYTKEEMLKQLGPGWVVSDEPLFSPEHATQAHDDGDDDEGQGGYDDGYPPSSWQN